MLAVRWFVCIVASLMAIQSAPAASIALASAGMGPVGQGIGLPVSSSNFVGWRFTLAKSTSITEVGGHLGAVSGNLFAAIVSLTAIDAMPQGAPFNEGTVKASTTFTPPALTADFRTPLSATLAPGAYALVIGSGQFTAVGLGMAPNSGQTNITPTTAASYVFWGQSPTGVQQWMTGAANNLRFTVTGNETAGPTDFNLDGRVDANDLAVWKAGFGIAPTSGVASGDANADGVVDGADFLAWQRLLTPTGASAIGPVPEPPTALLLLAAIAAGRTTLFSRCRRANRCLARGV